MNFTVLPQPKPPPSFSSMLSVFLITFSSLNSISSVRYFKHIIALLPLHDNSYSQLADLRLQCILFYFNILFLFIKSRVESVIKFIYSLIQLIFPTFVSVNLIYFVVQKKLNREYVSMFVAALR